LTYELNKPLVVVSGASGSGKTTLCRRLSKELGYYYAVSHTTRPQRKGETHGKDYHFVSEDVFDKMIKEGAFLEWARVYNRHYGTARSELFQDQYAGIIVDVDPQGAMAIRHQFPTAFLIFVKTPSIEILEQRLQKRGRDSAAELKKRLDEAVREETFIDRYDEVVINDNLEEAYKEFLDLIRSNEKKFSKLS